MATRDHTVRGFKSNVRSRAFSLVEVTICLGVASFALVSIFALIPVGLTNFRGAMNTSIGSQIAQKVLSEVQQSDFDALLTDYRGQTISGDCGSKACRFFDDQGSEVIPAGTGSANPQAAAGALSAEEKSKIVFWVNTCVSPATALPNESGGTVWSNPQLATVTVQVAFNPGNKDLVFQSGNSPSAAFLWSGASVGGQSEGTIPIRNHSAFVARSK